jgi:hypothetical protein
MHLCGQTNSWFFPLFFCGRDHGREPHARTALFDDGTVFMGGKKKFK